MSVEPRDPREVTLAYRSTNSINYRLLPYDRDLSTAVGGELPPLPSSLLVSSDGRVLWADGGLPNASDIAKAARQAKPKAVVKPRNWLVLGGAGAAFAIFVALVWRKFR